MTVEGALACVVIKEVANAAKVFGKEVTTMLTCLQGIGRIAVRVCAPGFRVHPLAHRLAARGCQRLSGLGFRALGFRV